MIGVVLNAPIADRHGGRARRLRVGEHVRSRRLLSLSGEEIAVPDGARLLHLQLRRFAGCPICNLHLRSFSERHREVAAAGVREVIVFHSTVEELRRYEADVPFAVIADPERRLYVEFGVESSPRALLDPRAWGAIVRGPLRSLRAAMRNRGSSPPLRPSGGRLGLPADILIAPDGMVLACKYGTHAYDQWSVDALLATAIAARS